MLIFNVETMAKTKSVAKHEPTLLEIFERLVVLETKFETRSDQRDEEAKKVAKQFTAYVIWLASLTVLNILFTIILIYLHLQYAP